MDEDYFSQDFPVAGTASALSLGLTPDPTVNSLNVGGSTSSYVYGSPEFSLGDLTLPTYSSAVVPVGSGSTSSTLGGVNSLISSVGSAVSNVARAVNGTPQAVIVGSPAGGVAGTVSGLARQLTSGVTSFLPLILIGLVVVFLFRAFTGGHKK
ncbi:MAG TPA: hypothetical protein VK742_08325 [Candidatus Sulfotelmatobacter sp.]|jgi:hypothetical protein|nr:hypothetical protein [Candidatus Sulfotelmatobacter sp.]